VGQATRTAGNMKESHHGWLEMEEGHHGWIPLDGSRLEKLRVEHLKNIESVELVERWEVTPVLMKYRLMPRLMILIENNCCGSTGSFIYCITGYPFTVIHGNTY